MMFPSNSYVDPCFSQNKEQVPYPSYPFYPYPVPSRPDLYAQPASYAPWPCPFNPTPPNGYSYPPGFYCPRPLFPYELPPPNFPNYYHPYFSLMPNHPAKYPQVDNTTLQTHCCGCPNHVCHGTQSPKVKIDEEKPEMDQTKIPHNTYPFFWFSPRNKAQQDEIEKSKERKEAQLTWPVVWMPEDEIKETENKNKQFTWPIAWMPEDEAKERKDQNANKQASEEAAKPNFRIIPLKFLENGDNHQAEIQKPLVGERKQGGEEAGKELTERGGKSQPEVKRIPVVEKKEGSEKGGKEQPSKEKDCNGGRVPERKHSKLPPVCLRVDPLPHKRTNNGSSRDEKSKKEVKVVDVKSAKDERKEKEIEIKTDTTEKFPERKNDDVKRVIMPEEDKIKKEIKVDVGRGSEGKELKESGIQGEDLKDKLEDRKVENVKRSQISEQDAAVLLQSVYRGCNVRRWEPLKKLKKIWGVHEKAQELLKKLQDVEESSKPLEKKEQLVLNESIMNLLLQLDTIQGLLPTVREVRKSVARELVSLQEKLDSLENQEAVETSTNESPKLDVQPTAANVSSEVCKSVPEQVQSQPSEVPTLECMTAQEEDEKSHEDGPVQLGLPQSCTDLDLVEEVPVKNEEDACSTTPEESQMAPLVEETRPADLLPETIIGEKYPEAQLCPLQTAASHALSEAAMHGTAVTSSIMKEIHDAEVAPRVAVTHGIDSAVTRPGIKNLQGSYEVEVHTHATERNAEGAAPEETLSEITTMEVDLLEEKHDSYAGTSVEIVELQETEDGKPSNEEMNVGGNEIASDGTVIALPEVMVHATKVLPDEGYVNDGDASAEKVPLLANEADEVKDENKSVEDNEVTALPEMEVTSIPGTEVVALPENKNSEGFHHVVEINEPESEVRPYLIQTSVMEVPPEVEVTNRATNVGKLSVEQKKLVEENEKLGIMLEKLMEAGKNQLDIINGLNEKVKGLEKKLEKKSKRSKVKVKKHKPVK